MRDVIVTPSLVTVFVLAFTVKAQLSVNSDSFLILHGSTSELIITYTKPPGDRPWLALSGENFRANTELFIHVPVKQLTEVISKVPEDIISTNNEITEEEADTSKVPNKMQTTLQALSLVNEEKLYKFKPAYGNNTISELSSNAPTEESTRPIKTQTESDVPLHVNLTKYVSGLSTEEEKASDKLAEAIESLAVDAHYMPTPGISILGEKPLETQFQNNNSSFTTNNVPNDIQVYNTSLESIAMPAEVTNTSSIKVTNSLSLERPNPPLLEVTNTSSLEVTNAPLLEVTNTSSVEVINTPSLDVTNIPSLEATSSIELTNSTSSETIRPLERNISLEDDVGTRSRRSLETSSMSIEAIDSPESKKSILVTVNSEYALTVSRNLLEINESLSVQSWRIALYGRCPGNVILLIQLEPSDPRVSDVVVHVDIERAHFWSVASSVFGWIYFVGWGLSAQFQVYENWKRKSVVGLNFDYLGLNMIGHSFYGIYNYMLYSSRSVQEEFFLRYPLSADPIQINDVVFSCHNSLVTLFTIFQCFYYDRGNQKVSRCAIFLFTIYGTWFFFSWFLAALTRMSWLDFINQCALIKFTITLIKYSPQAYMNFKRKSTVGWSIGAILLDFTGGFFSLIQMIVLAYNYDDWASFQTDTTKLGLSVFTLMFDTLFIVQHYVLYSHNNNARRFPRHRGQKTYKHEDTRPNSCYTNSAVVSK